MAIFGHRLSLRHLFPLAAATLFALSAGPAPAFFPPIPIYVPAPETKEPIKVPKSPPGTVTTGTSSGGGTTGSPQSTPEPASLVLALLGSGGVGLFAATRRRRPKA